MLRPVTCCQACTQIPNVIPAAADKMIDRGCNHGFVATGRSVTLVQMNYSVVRLCSCTERGKGVWGEGGNVARGERVGWAGGGV